MERLKFDVDTTKETERFRLHLSTSENKRIVFSAPFGSGKTHFLTNFFKDNGEFYNAFFINPVKYSIASNRDIFELIKADIIFQLFNSGCIKKSEEVSDFDTVSGEWFVKDRLLNIVGELVKIAPLLNPDTTSQIGLKFIELLPGLRKEYDEYKKGVNAELLTYETKLLDYLISKEQEVGNGFEMNEISNIIRTVLKRISTEGKKQNILIIDDFDRLDPEHIFRILNVLCVHNDYWDSDNKFGFDKIIIVCDIDKLEHYFKHRYGELGDFNGYMDKFYSSHYYRFRIESALINAIYRNTSSYTFHDAGSYKEQTVLLAALLGFFVRDRKLTIRKAIKCGIDFTLPDVTLFKDEIGQHFMSAPHITSKVIFLQSSDILFLNTLKTLITIWGDLKSFTKAIFDNENKKEKVSKHLSPYEIEAVIRSLSLALHLSKQHDIVSLIARKNENKYSTSNWNPPEIEILNHRVVISTSFSRGNPYMGDVSIFSKCRVNIESDTRNEFTYHDILMTINQIILGFQSNGYLEHFDM